ncbi:hypothetical protein ACFPOU_13890 [Massilia jejuensis]|uniref:DUF1206 domain-containing protein n=1 Tax=Massilia jejuensis TaxID=648894 RepID=A0ABW0PJH0_9BURK
MLAWQLLTFSPLSSHRLEILNLMDWFPIIAGAFKVLALGTGMFFAIKWHYDQGKKEQDKEKEKRAVLRAAGKVVIVFVLALLGLGVFTFVLISRLSLDLSFP